MALRPPDPRHPHTHTPIHPYSNGAEPGGSPMLSALLMESAGFGHAALEEQSPNERAWSPLPSPDGQLVQDPEFTLPTTAGPLRWQLFYHSYRAYLDGAFGFGRRASFPMRLCAQTVGGVTSVTLEREDGSAANYVNTGSGFTPFSPRIFDSLVKNGDGSWDETRFDSGQVFHYPTGSFVSLAYYQTPTGQRVTMSYDANQRLQSIQEPAGRQIAYSYDSN